MTQETLLRLDKVMARTGLSKSTIYRMMAKQEFPRQVRISHKVAAWRERDIDEWVAGILERAAA